MANLYRDTFRPTLLSISAPSDGVNKEFAVGSTSVPVQSTDSAINAAFTNESKYFDSVCANGPMVLGTTLRALLTFTALRFCLFC